MIAVAETPRRTSLVTPAAFLRKYGDEKGVELVNGKVVKLPMPGTRHSEVLVKAAVIFREYAKEKKWGRVLGGDTFIQTMRSPGSVRGADVCCLSYKRWPKNRDVPDGKLTVPPELVVEVKSPSDRWSEIQLKVAEYLICGVKVVIVLDPKTKSASIYCADDMNVIARNGDLVKIPDVLPGFSVPVKRFFET